MAPSFPNLNLFLKLPRARSLPCRPLRSSILEKVGRSGDEAIKSMVAKAPAEEPTLLAMLVAFLIPF